MNEEEKQEFAREVAEHAMNWAAGWLMMHAGYGRRKHMQFINASSRWAAVNYPMYQEEPQDALETFPPGPGEEA